MDVAGREIAYGILRREVRPEPKEVGECSMDSDSMTFLYSLPWGSE